MRNILRWCAASAVALVLCASAAKANPITKVYRADTRPPTEVFLRGFVGRGQRMDVLAHTLGGACDETDLRQASTWVSTSSEYEEALGFARGHLEGLPSGPQNTMWLYFIRPDTTFVVVRALLERAADEGRGNRSGYTPEQAGVLEHLLRNSLISTEAEVITHYVAPAHIIHARPVWFDENDDLQIGAVVENSRYLDLETEASRVVADLQAFVPAASIRVGLLDDDGTSSGSESDQCSMTCDGATTASSFAVAQSASVQKTCKTRKRASPAVLDIILGY